MQRIYPILYFIFICCGFLVGQLYLPGSPLNNLQILTLIMLYVCIQCDKIPPCDKYIQLYFYFMILYFIFEFITGYVDKFIAFFRTFLFIGYVFYWATKILIMRFNTFWPLVVAGVVIGTLDSFVTVFQALGIPISIPIIQTLVVDKSVEDYLSNHDDGMGVAISGLYFSPVINGHNLLFFYMLSLLAHIKKKCLWLIPFSVVIMIGLFFCQQRSPFFIAIFMSFALYVMNVGLTSTKIVSLLIVLLIIIVYVFPVLFDFVDTTGSRILSDDDSNRLTILEKGFTYFLENPFVGSYHDFIAEKKSYPHNLFLSVLVSGGLLGLFLILRMLYIQFIFIVDKFRFYKCNIWVLFLSFCYCALLLDSLFHNTGWVDGDYATFISWSLCYFSLTFGSFNEKVN